jgi:hypothetical protein
VSEDGHGYSGDFGLTEAAVAEHVRVEHPSFIEWTSPDLGQTTMAALHRALHRAVTGYPTAYNVRPVD